MSERNDKMAAMLAADAPAAHDLIFEIAVMAKIERRRFVRDMAMNLMLGAVLTLLLALLMPGLETAGPALAGIDVWLLPAAALLLTLPFCWWIARRPA